MLNSNFFQAELVEKINFSSDLALFKFLPDKEFNFKPGQYATIAIENGEKLIQRPYSIVSSPHEPFLEFYIELVPNGALTPRIFDLKIGSKALIRSRITGHFILDEKSGMKNHLMVATVTGAAPFISIVRTQRFEMKNGKSPAHRFVIIHGASHSLEFGIYQDELTEAARDGWLTYVPTVSRPWEDTDWKGETGRVDDLIRKYIDRFEFDHSNTICYACGHPQMIETVKGILTRTRFRKEQVKEEKYFTIK
jgi:ferredoxin/flavodoxin---NADP+ reductase